VEFEGEQLSYRGLNRRADELARRLRRAGADAESFVGVMLERSAELIVALLAVSKAGAAYVPINPNDPARRSRFILEDARVKTLVTTAKVARHIPVNELAVVCVDDETDDRTPAHEFTGAATGRTATAEGLAYLMYTSGSTGEPKGVAVEHRSVVNYVTWAADTYLRGERLDFALYSSLAFDLTVTSVFTPLLTGGRVVVHPADGELPPLADILDGGQVGALKLTPAHLSLVKGRDNSRSAVRRLIVGGEALATAAAREAYDSFGGRVEVFNEYGPTEATVGCMIYRFDPERDRRATVAVGRPAPNTSVYVLDRRLGHVADQTVGEMFVGGDALARGYHGRPALTAERFLPDPFSAEPGRRMYRTGDLARRLPGGDLEFLGRADDQVKLHGHRIELGEVEAALNAHEEVSQAAVVLREDAPGDRRLVAYVVPAGGPAPSSDELRGFLRERLPVYMTPSAFVTLDALPLTRNGKVDRRALPAPPRAGRGGLAVAYAPPQTEVEVVMASIWRGVLRLDEVGIHDDFFGLGGQSILAIQIIHRVNQSFGVNLPMRAIFDDPTVTGLSLLVEETLVERLETAPEAI
ncbi:MAG: non-ribosomal peptide synthetase, partial [Pyrinomonadaceae bacterium]